MPALDLQFRPLPSDACDLLSRNECSHLETTVISVCILRGDLTRDRLAYVQHFRVLKHSTTKIYENVGNPESQPWLPKMA